MFFPHRHPNYQAKSIVSSLPKYFAVVGKYDFGTGRRKSHIK